MPRDLSPSTPTAEGLSPEGLARVDAAVETHIESGTLAGAVTLVARHGRIVHLNAMGLKDRERGEPMAPDTLFRIFSMTKPVTAVAMMILYDRGLWRPEDPIAKHLPEFAGVQVFAGLDAHDRPILVPPDHPPTMHELMTHTAGFAYGIGIAPNPDPVERLYVAAEVLKSRSAGEMVRRLAAQPLAYQPGSKWRYSLSSDLQGAVIEHLSGQSLADFMAEQIFAPLGMIDTAFYTPPEKINRLAALYFQQGETPSVPISNPISPDRTEPPGFALGGGGLISTATDYARFAQMLLDRGSFDGKRLVSEGAMALMMTNHLPESLLETRFGAGHQKFRPGFGYGYNGVVFHDPEAAGMPVGRGTYHWDGAAGTWFWVDPVNDLVFVGLIQLLSWTPPALQATTQRLIAEAFVSL
jgi:CubicO group peptidase (beta-lactamase class C family)